MNDNWPRSPNHGYLAKETNKKWEPNLNNYPTKNTAFMAAGALFAGNYFGGEVEQLAEKFFQSVNFGGAIGDGGSQWILTQASDGIFRKTSLN